MLRAELSPRTRQRRDDLIAAALQQIEELAGGPLNIWMLRAIADRARQAIIDVSNLTEAA